MAVITKDDTAIFLVTGVLSQNRDYSVVLRSIMFTSKSLAREFIQLHMKNYTCFNSFHVYVNYSTIFKKNINLNMDKIYESDNDNFTVKLESHAKSRAVPDSSPSIIPPKLFWQILRLLQAYSCL